MTSTLHSSILKAPEFSRAARRLENAVENELRKKSFPIDPNILTRPLSVSFPAQIGFARYDIETTSGREPVGTAFAVDREKRMVRHGLVKVLLVEAPITVLARGLSSPEKVEVVVDEKLIGEITECEQVDKSFSLRSDIGIATIVLKEDCVSVSNGSQSFKFPLQLDLDYFPNPFKRKVEVRNSSIVYDPEIRFCNPIVVMGFLLCLRMIYRRADF